MYLRIVCYRPECHTILLLCACMNGAQMITPTETILWFINKGNIALCMMLMYNIMINLSMSSRLLEINSTSANKLSLLHLQNLLNSVNQCNALQENHNSAWISFITVDKPFFSGEHIIFSDYSDYFKCVCVFCLFTFSKPLKDYCTKDAWFCAFCMLL